MENGWNEWSKFVLKELERQSDCIDEVNKSIARLTHDMNKRFEEVNIEIATLKVKAGLWGALGGAIPVALGLLIMFIKR